MSSKLTQGDRKEIWQLHTGYPGGGGAGFCPRRGNSEAEVGWQVNCCIHLGCPAMGRLERLELESLAESSVCSGDRKHDEGGSRGSGVGIMGPEVEGQIMMVGQPVRAGNEVRWLWD